MQNSQLVLPLLASLIASPLTAQFLPYGSGCGSSPAPVLRPAPGALLDGGLPYTIACHDVPAGAPGFLAFSLTDTSPGTPLTAYGMPGCLLYNNADITVLMTTTGTVAQGTLTMPSVPCGLTVFTQAAVIDPGANALGVSLSNAARCVIDGATDAPLHRATAANVTGNWTAIDHPDLNGEPEAVFVAQRYSGSGGGSDIGVWFNAAIDRWTVFHQNTSVPMPTNAQFRLMLPNSRARQFRWRATPGNTSGHIVRIDHPAINGDPNAMIHVTKLYESGAGFAGYHTAPIGVWFDGSRWTIFNQDISPMPAAAAFQVIVDDAELESVVASFVHTTASNGALTRLDHPALNGNPNARVIVTQHFGPPGAGGVYNPSHVVAGYDSLFSQRWQILNYSGPVPGGASFNVLVLDSQPRGRTWTQLSAGSATLQVAGGTSNALFSTANWNPPGSSGVYNDHETALQYSTFYGAWFLRNIDGTPLPNGAAFNFLTPNAEAATFSAAATAANTSGSDLALDHPALNGDPNAIAFIQPVMGVASDHPTGLVYSASSQRWSIRNLDAAAMPTGAQFYVLVATPELTPHMDTFTFAVSGGNLGSSPHVARIDHPDLDGRPDARILVTRKVGAGGAAGAHPIGVYYSSVTQGWVLFNQGFQPLPLGAEFHVLYERDCP